jgi:hypothetical protein
MSLIVPPNVNYPSPLIAIPAEKSGRTPREGQKLISCVVNWGSMGGASKCVSFNLSNNATLEFSQIVALSVDNSACGSDVIFAFPDSEETLTIPAYSPKDIIPVFTNQTQFYVVCPKALSTDISRFSILNFLPPPASIPVTQLQNVAANSQVNIAATGATQLIPVGVNGTIQGINICEVLTASAGTSGTVYWTLVDGGANILAAGNGAAQMNTSHDGMVFSLTGLELRFTNGLSIAYTSAALIGNSYLAVSIYYRAP